MDTTRRRSRRSFRGGTRGDWQRLARTAVDHARRRLGLHAQDNNDAAGPKVIHAFLARDTPGYHVDETWDTLGMRATHSDDTVLEGAFIPDASVVRSLPPGMLDAFILAMFANALVGFGAIYYAIAERARDLAITSARKRTSMALTRSMAYHPEVQHLFADMQLEIEPMGPHLERVAQDWSDGVDHGGAWPMKIIALKHRIIEGAKKVVDLALASTGGPGMFKSSELERLYRDVRCGGFHPANSMLTYEIIGKTTLGVGLDASPRWGSSRAYR